MSSAKISSSSSGSVKQRFHFGEVIPIRHCHCGNEKSLQTSWSSDNPGRRYWGCVGINGMQGCGFFDWFDPQMCSRSKKIIPGLLKPINLNEEEIERFKALLRRADVPKKSSCGRQCTLWLVVVVLFLFLVAIGLRFINVITKNGGKASNVYMLP